MNTAFNIIVIILSATLFIFLVLSIVVMGMVVKLVKSLRQIVAKGEQLVDSAEAIGDTLRRNAGAVNVARLLMGFVGRFTNEKDKRE
jgi:cell division septal protein FtsQ